MWIEINKVEIQSNAKAHTLWYTHKFMDIYIYIYLKGEKINTTVETRLKWMSNFRIYIVNTLYVCSISQEKCNEKDLYFFDLTCPNDYFIQFFFTI